MTSILEQKAALRRRIDVAHEECERMIDEYRAAQIKSDFMPMVDEIIAMKLDDCLIAINKVSCKVNEVESRVIACEKKLALLFEKV